METLKDLLSTIKAENSRIEEEKKIYINSCNKFQLIVIYEKKYFNGQIYNDFNMPKDIINLEGIKNAYMIFNEYRNNAFAVGIKSLELNIIDEKNTRVKKINYKYKNNRYN